MQKMVTFSGWPPPRKQTTNFVSIFFSKNPVTVVYDWEFLTQTRLELDFVDTDYLSTLSEHPIGECSRSILTPVDVYFCSVQPYTPKNN